MESAALSLVSNVGQLLGKEFRLLRRVGGDVARLRNELATINALVRMQSEADEGAVNHFVREWLKQLREVGYDAEDCIHFYLFGVRVRRRPGDRCFAALTWSKRLLITLCRRRQLAVDIKHLHALASAINEQHARYGVSLESLLRHPVDGAAGPVADLVASRALRPADLNEIVSFQDQVNNLASKVRALKDDDQNDKKLKVFSIVGFGGLGKTTLAVEVCRQLKTEFHLLAQVPVSQTFTGKDLQGLLKRLLRQIVEPEQERVISMINSMTEDKLRSELKNKLSDKSAATLNSNKTEDVLSKIDAMTVDELRSELKNILIDKSAAKDVLNKIDAMTVDELRSELEKILSNKRYLILIDDVWSTTAWDLIRSKLPSSNCGSRIIVTTRIDTVAKACSTTIDGNGYYIHRMEKLGEEESKKLFISKAGPFPKDSKLEPAMITSILNKCGGLPLAIVSIGSLLASYKLPQGKKMWETVQKSIGSQMETNPTLEGMRQILTLSYNHLPHHLKPCIMYLGIFPDDYIIRKDRLLKRWVAEGLIAEKRGLTQMELAEGYFNELVSRSMIDLADEREERCRVHDMMLEILVSKSLEANFVSLVGGQYDGMSYTDTIRRLSIHGGLEAHNNKGSSSSKKKKGTIITGNNAGINEGMTVQHVRSLSIFDPEVNKKLLARLGEFTLLRVLDLEECKGLEEEHLRCICRMYLLRFLSLKGTGIKVMPPRIGGLEHLQTLDVRETDLKDLPEAIKKLEKLEHLLFSEKSTKWSGWRLTQGINKMKALRQVNRAVIYDSKAAEEVGELEQLEELAIYVNTREKVLTKKKMTRSDSSQEVVKKLAGSLSKFWSLRWLEIGNLGCGIWPFKQIMNFLHDVESPPRLLRYLKIWGCMDTLPAWVGSLTDLVECEIAWTYLDGFQLFSVLCELPNLKRLVLGSYFIRKGQNMVARSSQPFLALKELTLGYSPEVPQEYRFEEGSMPKLETLVMKFGDQLKRISGIEHLGNLKEVQYSGANPMEWKKQNPGLSEKTTAITVTLYGE